jgi:hypothetical protein
MSQPLKHLLQNDLEKVSGREALFRLVHSAFASLPDDRVGDVEIALPDALMSAFAIFYLKYTSLLAFDKEHAEGNLHTIYGIERVPCDTHMRAILDPVSPKSLRPVFKSVLRQLQRGKALEAIGYSCGLDQRFLSDFRTHIAAIRDAIGTDN